MTGKTKDDLQREIDRLQQQINAMEPNKSSFGSTPNELLGSLPAHVFSVDLNLKITFINYTVPGVTPEEIVGTPALELIPPELRKSAAECYAKVQETAEPARYFTSFTRPDGFTHHFEARVGAVVESEQVIGFVVIGLDVTDQRKLVDSNQQLEAANQQLRAAEQQLRASNQQLEANNQQLRATEQQLRASNQRLEAANQQLRATEEQLRESEAKFRTLVTENEEIVYMIDKDGTFLLSEGKGLAKLGLSPGQVVGASVFDLYKDYPDMLNAMTRAFSGERVVADVEVAGTHFKSWYSPYQDRNGEVAGLLGLSVNITAEKREEAARCAAEQQLRASNQQLEAANQQLEAANQQLRLSEEKLFDSERLVAEAQRIGRVGVWTWDAGEDRVVWNDVLYEIAGLDPNQPPPTYEEHGALYEPLSWVELQAAVERAIQHGEHYELELNMIRPGGEVRVTRTSGGANRDDSGAVTGLYGTVQDVTETKRAEDELRQSERNYRNLFESAEVGMYQSKLDGSGVLEVNQKSCDIVGYSREEILAQPSFFHWENPEDREEMVRVLAAKGSLLDHEIRIVAKSGDVKTLLFSSKVDKTNGVLEGSIVDITELKKLQAVMRSRELELRSIFDSTMDAIFVCRMDGTIVRANVAAAKMHGYTTDELVGMHVSKLVHPESAAQFGEFMEAISAGHPYSGEAMDVRKDGSAVEVEVRGAPLDLEGVPHILGALQDISGRKEAQRSLRKSEERFRSLVENISEVFYLVDVEGTPEYVSPACELVLGYTPEELEHSSIWHHLHPDDVERARASFEEVFRDGSSSEDYRVRTKSGEYRWIAVSNKARYQGQEPVGLQGVMTDITDRKQAEESLRRSDVIVASSKDMLALLDANYTYLHANKAYTDAFEIAPDQLIGRTVPEVFGETFSAEVIRPHADPCLAGQHVSYEAWFEFPGAGRRFMQITYEPFASEGGSVEGFIVNGRDITDRKTAEDALQQHKEQLEETVKERTEELLLSEQRLAEETAATAEIVGELLTQEADDSETERQVLNACLGATGSKFGMIGVINEHGKFDTITYNGESLEGCAFPDAMAWDLTTGMTIRGIWGWPMIHGEPLLCNDLKSHPEQVGQPEGHVPIECFLGVPVKEDGKVTGMVAVANKHGGFSPEDRESLTRLVAIMTVSRQYRQAFQSAELTGAELERKVEERTSELQAVNRELESFAYSISHDLRAPLRAIDGFSKAVLEDYGDKVNDVGKDHLNRVRSGAQRMGKLIDDLLQLSRLTRVEMKRVKVDLSSIAREVCEELMSSNPDRSVDLDIAKDLAGWGDPTLLRSVVENLLSNAWKFTSAKQRAEISMGQTTCEGNPAFFVRDNGAGFDMEYSDKLFGVFQRLHDTEEFPGTGVGLATVQRVIKRHGGRVWGEGTVNRGATFYFTLPTQDPERGK